MHINFDGPALLVIVDPKSKVSLAHKVDIGDDFTIDSSFEVRIFPLISSKYIILQKNERI